MSTDNQNTFNKENLDLYLKELGKEYRKLVGKGMPTEIILIGGAAILANYGFREMTTDVDAVIKAASSMKDAINTVGDMLCSRSVLPFSVFSLTLQQQVLATVHKH